MAASIRCYFDTISLKQSGFAVSERKYKNNLKNRESQKKIIILMYYTMFI